MLNEQITCTVADACRMSGLGKTTLYALLGQNKLKGVTVGRRKLIRVDSLRELLSEAA